MANLDGVDRSHYERMKIQPIDFIEANEIPWAEGEAIKYICRYKHKDGIKDLRKARDILDRLMASEEKKQYKIARQLETAEQMKKAQSRPINWLEPWPPEKGKEKVRYRWDIDPYPPCKSGVKCDE